MASMSMNIRTSLVLLTLSVFATAACQKDDTSDDDVSIGYGGTCIFTTECEMDAPQRLGSTAALTTASYLDTCIKLVSTAQSVATLEAPRGEVADSDASCPEGYRDADSLVHHVTAHATGDTEILAVDTTGAVLGSSVLRVRATESCDVTALDAWADGGVVESFSFDRWWHEVTISPTFYSSDHTELEGWGGFDWAVEDPLVAEVETASLGSPMLVPKKAGTTTITLSTAEFSRTYPITVVPQG